MINHFIFSTLEYCISARIFAIWSLTFSTCFCFAKISGSASTTLARFMGFWMLELRFDEVLMVCFDSEDCWLGCCQWWVLVFQLSSLMSWPTVIFWAGLKATLVFIQHCPILLWLFELHRELSLQVASHLNHLWLSPRNWSQHFCCSIPPSSILYLCPSTYLSHLIWQ